MKLKTLKDLEMKGRGIVNSIRLKQEAINRAKYYKEKRDTWDRKKFPDEWYFWQGKMGAELFAHNLKEEDLK